MGKLSWPGGCSSPSSTVLAGVVHLGSMFPVGALLQGLLLHHSSLQGNTQLMVFKAGSSVSCVCTRTSLLADGDALKVKAFQSHSGIPP